MFSSSSVFTEYQSEDESALRTFSMILWGITALIAIGLCINLMIILRIFSEFETTNPLRKPLLFSAGAIILVLGAAALARKKFLSLFRVLLPGIVVGLVWTAVVRDLFQGIYLTNPEFPIATEVLEAVFVINFCFLGTAWLNKVAHEGQ